MAMPHAHAQAYVKTACSTKLVASSESCWGYSCNCMQAYKASVQLIKKLQAYKETCMHLATSQ